MNHAVLQQGSGEREAQGHALPCSSQNKGHTREVWRCDGNVQFQLVKWLMKDWYKLARDAPLIFSRCTATSPKPRRFQLGNTWALGWMENLPPELLITCFRKISAVLILPLILMVGILVNTCSLLCRQTDANAAEKI